MNVLITWDNAVFHSLNQFHHVVMDIFFLWITQFGAFHLAALIFLLTHFSKRKDRWKMMILAILLLLATNFVSGSVLKPLFHRARPCEVLDHVILLYDACPKSGSFPSSHAANIFAIAVFLGSHYPNCTGFLGLCTILISLSRIYTGVHYPLDILGGAVLGIVFGFIWIRLEKKHFSK